VVSVFASLFRIRFANKYSAFREGIPILSDAWRNYEIKNIYFSPTLEVAAFFSVSFFFISVNILGVVTFSRRRKKDPG
jgi:hypothetical protein